MPDTKLKLILALVILFFPLASSVLISLFTKRHKALSAGLSVGAVAIGLVSSIVLFVKFYDAKIKIVATGLQWLELPGFAVD
ncbi:uncharacterized protein METZ01_LOCUS319257, partial [marine metagenome]